MAVSGSFVNCLLFFSVITVTYIVPDMHVILQTNKKIILVLLQNQLGI